MVKWITHIFEIKILSFVCESCGFDLSTKLPLNINQRFIQFLFLLFASIFPNVGRAHPCEISWRIERGRGVKLGRLLSFLLFCFLPSLYELVYLFTHPPTYISPLLPRAACLYRKSLNPLGVNRLSSWLRYGGSLSSTKALSFHIFHFYMYPHVRANTYPFHHLPLFTFPLWYFIFSMLNWIPLHPED